MPRQTLYQSPHAQSEPWPPESPVTLLSNETSRDVYRTSCESIARSLELEGFKYLKSKQLCLRDKGNFRYKVQFQSSRHNISGMHVQLWMHADVSSNAIKEWRLRCLPAEFANDYVAGGMVHRLGQKFAFVQWELADPDDRVETIKDAIIFIRNEVLPYFAQFEDIQSLLASLVVKDIPAFDMMQAIEFAYIFGDRQLAQAVMDGFFLRRPDLLVIVKEQIGEVTVDPWCYAGSFAKQVAFLRHYCGLELRM